MVIKLYSISDWKKVTTDDVVRLVGRNDQSRKIRLEVNSRWPVRVALMRKDDDPFHLGTIDGLDTIEFFWSGEAVLSFSAADGGKNVEVWIFTKDGEQTSVEVPDPEIFTQVMQHRSRNPDLEWMQYQMQSNMRRLLEQQALDSRNQMDALRAEMANIKAADPTTGEIVEPQTNSGGTGEGAAEPSGDVPASGQEPASPGSVVEGGTPASAPSETTGT